MAGSDNILSAVTGALEGFSNAFVPFQQAKLQDSLLRRRKEEDRTAEMKQYKQKLPLQFESERQSTQMKSDIDIAQKRALRQEEEDSQIRVNAARPQPTYVVNPQGGTLLPGQRPFNATVPISDKKLQERDAKLQAEYPKAQGAFERAMTSYDEMLGLAKKIKDDKDLASSTGLIGGRQKLTGGARRVDANLSTLKSKALLNVMSDLKALSATGSTGFGATSQPEIDAMQNSISNLSRMVDTKDFKKNADDFIRQVEASKNIIKKTFHASYGKFMENNGAESGLPVNTGGGSDNNDPLGLGF